MLFSVPRCMGHNATLHLGLCKAHPSSWDVAGQPLSRNQMCKTLAKQRKWLPMIHECIVAAAILAQLVSSSCNWGADGQTFCKYCLSACTCVVFFVVEQTDRQVVPNSAFSFAKEGCYKDQACPHPCLSVHLSAIRMRELAMVALLVHALAQGMDVHHGNLSLSVCRFCLP